MKKIILWITVLCTVLFFAGCVRDDASGPDGTDLETESIPVYTIVRADSSSESVTQACVLLRKLLEEKYGIRMGIETDWVKKGDPVTRYGREILVGATNREESSALSADFSASEQALDYMIRSAGEHYVIMATDSAADAAVRYFAESVPLSQSIADVVQPHVFPLDNFTVCGRDIGEFTIVYPASYNSYQKNDVFYLRDLIYGAVGAKLNVVDSSSAPSEHEIVIGCARENGYGDLAPLDYTVDISGDRILLGGNNYYADMKALYKFIREHICYSTLDNTYSLPSVQMEESASVYRYREISVMLSGWCTSGDEVNSEAQIKDMAECGLNIIGMSVPADKAMLHNLLKWAAVYGVEILWTDWNVYANFTADDFKTLISDYADAPVTWGNYIYDEPNSDKFGELSKAYARYAADTGKVPFINLFPIYASREQLGNDTYREHVVQYLDTVNPRLCSVDIYPLNSHGLNADYMQNLDIVASECRTRGIDLSVYIQSVSFASSKRTPSAADLSWQAYCCLSFGAKGIQYFTYMTPYSDAEDFKPALIDHDGNKTGRWHYAQQLNQEISVFSDVFVTYRNSGAFNWNCTADTPYLNFENQYRNFAAIKAIDCKNPLLFGCFENDAGQYAFTAVNMTDLQRSKGISDVRVKTDIPVTLYQNGQSTVLAPDKDGYVAFTLDVGEGIFAVVGEE